MFFLRETDGTLHLARVYPEGFDVQDARAAGSNRFVIAADDAIEIWAFDNGMAFAWHRPKTHARFLWRDQIVVSESQQFAAVIGEVVFQKTYVFLIDLEVPELVEINLLGSSHFQAVVRAVEDAGHITLSQDRRIGSPQIRIDPTTGRAQPMAPTSEGLRFARPELARTPIRGGISNARRPSRQPQVHGVAAQPDAFGSDDLNRRL